MASDNTNGSPNGKRDRTNAPNAPNDAGTSGEKSSSSSSGGSSSSSSSSLQQTLHSVTTTARFILTTVLLLISLQQTHHLLHTAYDIRLHALNQFGFIIHEFDPYFNFRAATHLYEQVYGSYKIDDRIYGQNDEGIWSINGGAVRQNKFKKGSINKSHRDLNFEFVHHMKDYQPGNGWRKGWKNFVQWFDYKVWYPLGRPVGTTIYPGMQVTAVWLTKCWLPVWYGIQEWFERVFGPLVGGSIKDLGIFRFSGGPYEYSEDDADVTKRMVNLPPNEAVHSFMKSNSSIMAGIAALMGNMNLSWKEMSLNDVCCLMPAWFGAMATLVTGLLALECSAHFSVGSSVTYGRSSRFGTVLDEIPLIGFAVRYLTTPIRNVLAKFSGMDTSEKGSAQLSFGNDMLQSTSAFQTTSLLSMLATMFFMSTVPAHLMRSVGGGFDNESVAMFAMTLVFFLWTRSLRGCPTSDDEASKAGNMDNVDPYIRQKQDYGFKLSPSTRTSLLRGAATGLAYFYMVMSWGGYVFVINLIAAHAGALVMLGRHSSKLHAAYSAFYVVGTALATRVPVVGLAPLRSLEQAGPLVAFFGIQLVEYCERLRTRDNLTRRQVWLLRVRIFGLAGVAFAGVVMALWPTGYFGPISSRVRGLFVKHTKTGNPLVDSVAEHQAAKPGTYDQYLDIVAKMAPVGFGIVAVGFTNDASSFLLVYGLAAYFFSHKMVRLILLTAPIASVLSGIAVGRVAGCCVEGICGWRMDVWDIFDMLFHEGGDSSGSVVTAAAVVEARVIPEDSVSPAKKGKKKKAQDAKKSEENASSITSKSPKQPIHSHWLYQIPIRLIWVAITYYLVMQGQPYIKPFQEKCQQMSVAMSHPSILFKAQTNDGRTVLVDDYREAYWWVRDNTEEDARIMAWWDYGYQITAIANRTTIADGNTWNHEHIALLGRALTSPLKDGHRIARHLADYVLLWTGGGGDDLAKSPHLARIANSVYRSMCPGDPTCSKFSMPGGRPSPMMRESLLYKLHSNGIQPGVEVDKNRFKEVFKSKHGKVRIYRILSVSKESKEWVENNRVCDVPGSWFCPGQYPPGLQKVLKEKKDFKQLEDFNAKTEDDSEYQKKYFEHLSDPEKARRRAQIKEQREKEARESGASLDAMEDSEPPKELTKQQIREINQRWEDNAVTSNLFRMIQMKDIDSLAMVLENQPAYAHVRSKDGRGPMWWAHEHGSKEAIALLKSFGVSEKLRDKDGITPLDMTDDEF